MKIINKGIDLENWALQIKCADDFVTEGCGALLEINAKDIKSSIYDRVDDEYYAVCPICNQRIVIDDDLIPDAIKYQIRNKNTLERELEL